jgi:hypothetical protein
MVAMKLRQHNDILKKNVFMAMQKRYKEYRKIKDKEDFDKEVKKELASISA